jgi:hypothetical protein
MSPVPQGDETRTQAEAFAAALEVGAATVHDVADWADAIIEREASPHWSICELARCRNLYPPDVVHLLRDVPGASDRSETHRLLMQMLGESLAKDSRRANQIASSLYSLAMADEISDPDLKALAWWAWDALDLADSGLIAETRNEIVEAMRSALAQCAMQRD